MIFSSWQNWPILLIAIAVLLWLAWFAWARPDLAVNQKITPWLLRAIGVLLVAFAIADPLLIKQSPAKGANLLAILADDSNGLRVVTGPVP